MSAYNLFGNRQGEIVLPPTPTLASAPENPFSTNEKYSNGPNQWQASQSPRFSAKRLCQCAASCLVVLGIVTYIGARPQLDHFAQQLQRKSVTTIEGGTWSKQVHAAIEPALCNVDRTFFDSDRLTVLATFPRSGNSYIREMVERSTGHWTTSVYCDGILEKTFKGECNHTNTFFQKTHYPSLGAGLQVPVNPEIAKAVSIIRNPLDCLMSYYSYILVRKDVKLRADKHTAHVQGIIGEKEEEVAVVQALALRWLEFHDFWNGMKIPQLQLRYEDLRTQPLGLLLNLLSFILPEGKRPDLNQVLCALELKEEEQAYASAKRATFSSWDSWTPELRNWIVQNTADQWCRLGYDTLLESVHGAAAVESTGVDCKKFRSEGPTAGVARTSIEA